MGCKLGTTTVAGLRSPYSDVEPKRSLDALSPPHLQRKVSVSINHGGPFDGHCPRDSRPDRSDVGQGSTRKLASVAVKLLSSSTDAIISVDRKGHIFDLNHIAETLSGYSREELIGQVVDVLLPEDLRAVHTKHREAFVDRPSIRRMGTAFDLVLRRKDGEETPVDIVLSPIGKLGKSGVTCIVRDVGVNRERETQLRQQAKHQAALARLGQRALSPLTLEVLFDETVAILATALDVEYCKVLKRLPDREALLLVSGMGWRDGLVGRATVGINRHSQAGYTLLSDEPVVVADLPTEARFTGPPLLTEHGVVSGMSVVIGGREGPWGVLGAHTAHRRDFSKEEIQFFEAVANLLGMAIERERAEEAQRQSEDRMRASQKLEAIGRLAGGIAHDFNNLLLIIISSAEMLDSDGEHEEAKRIQSAAKRAASLTHQLLAFSRRQTFETRILDINAEISEIEEMLRRLLGEDVELVTTLASDVGRVRADPGQLHQVILNLALNARDALPHGGRLGIETAKAEIGNDEPGAHASLGPGSYVAIRVSDTGVGMDADTCSKAFEPFFSTKGDSGTGLGLATVYGIVSQCGGSIRIESEKGRGTTFEILLPQVDEQLDTPSQLNKTADVPRGAETILVVEDDEAVLEVVCLELRRHGYNVLESSGPVAALEVSEQHTGSIALVVSDMVMPGIRGDELVRRLRDARPGLPALIVSGYARDAGDDSWQREPNTSFLAKPFMSTQLAQKVREVLDNQPETSSTTGIRVGTSS